MKKVITVRVDSELLAATRRCAKQENRTLTNFIETVLRQQISASNRELAGPMNGGETKLGSVKNVS